MKLPIDHLAEAAGRCTSVFRTSLLLLVVSFSISDAQDYYYPDYSDFDKSQMFIPGASVPSAFAPFTIAVLQQAYCSPTSSLLRNIDPVFKRLTVERNIRISITCQYSAPTSIQSAIVLFEQLSAGKQVDSGVDALLGDYNPLVSTIAASLDLAFLIVSAESTDMNQRLLGLGNRFSEDSSRTSIGSYADLNDNTFVVDSFWYRNFLQASILAASPGFGPEVFGSNFPKFQRLGIICDDAASLSQFMAVDKGPLITQLHTTQLSTLYPPTPAGLNNVSALSMDAWTSAYSKVSASTNVQALLISTNTTYSMMLLPNLIRSLINVGFFNPDTLTLMTNIYLSESTFLSISDAKTTVFFSAGVAYLDRYSQVFPAGNITLGVPAGFYPVAPLSFDPTVSAIASALYFVSMSLVTLVYKPAYIQYVIAQRNWPSVIVQDGFLRYSIRYGIAQQQYNRCQYVLNVLQVTPANCTAAEYQQPLFNVIGYWSSAALLTKVDDAYTAIVNSTTQSSTPSLASTVNVSTSLFYKTVKVGLVVNDPYVSSCEECRFGHSGYAIDLIGNLSSVLRFSYSYISFNSYRAMLEQLSSGGIDMAIGAFLYNSTNITSSHGYQYQLVGPMVQSGINLLMSNSTRNQWWSWVRPMSSPLWFTILLLMILLTLVFIALDHIEPSLVGKRLFDFFASYWYVFGSFTQSSVEIIPVTLSVKLLSMLMWFTVIIVVSAFTAAYSSFLIGQPNSPFVSSVSEALEYYQSTSTPFYVVAGSPAAEYLSAQYPALYSRAMADTASYFVDDVYAAVSRFIGSPSTSVFIGDARVNQWVSNLVDCWAVTVGEIDGAATTLYSTLALPVGSPYFKQLNLEIVNLRRRRLLTVMDRFYFSSTCSGDTIPQPLTSQLYGLYFVLAVGCVISLTSAILEEVIKKTQLQAQRQNSLRQKSFQFGLKYVASIDTVRENSIVIKVFHSEKDFRRFEAHREPERAPMEYIMDLEDLNIGNAKIKRPSQLRLEENDGILVKYLGINPAVGEDRFIFVKSLIRKAAVDDKLPFSDGSSESGSSSRS